MTDLEMMKDPGNWPNWPVLPVKNTKNDGFPVIGVITCNGLPIVYIKNMFDLVTGKLSEQLKDVPMKTYSSFEELIEAGWVVD